MWLYIPFPFAQDSEASSEDLNLRHLERLSQCCTLSGNCPSPRSLQTRLKQEGYLLLRSGLTLRPSQAAQSLDIWIESESIALQADTPANHSALQVRNLGRTIRDIFGRSSLKRLSDIHQRCVSSRMSEGILFSDFEKSASVWNDWITGLRQVYSQRQRSVQVIDEKGCSSSAWPTAAARDYKGSSANRDRTSGALDEAAEQTWATPNTCDRGIELTKPRLQSGAIDLQSQVVLHQDQTPTGDQLSNDGQILHQQWATASSGDAKNTRNRTSRTTRGGNDGETLCDQVHPKRLNPIFVVWLMGYPVQTNYEHWETQSFLSVQRWLFSVCGQR